MNSEIILDSSQIDKLIEQVRDDYNINPIKTINSIKLTNYYTYSSLIIRLFDVIGQDIFIKLMEYKSDENLNYLLFEIMEILITNNKFFELNYEMTKKLEYATNDEDRVFFEYLIKFGFGHVVDYKIFYLMLKSLAGPGLNHVNHETRISYIKYLFANCNSNHIKGLANNEEHHFLAIHLMVSYDNELFNLILNAGVMIPTNYDKNLREYPFYYKTKLALRTVIDHSHIARDNFHIQSNVRRGTEIKEIRRFCYLPPSKEGKFITVLRNITSIDFKYLLDYKLIKHAAFTHPQAYHLRGDMTPSELRIKMWKKGFSYIFNHDKNFTIISNIITKNI